MRILDPGPKAVFRSARNFSGLMSVNVEFEADQELAESMIQMLYSNEKFYVLVGTVNSQKIPVMVSEVFRPSPAYYTEEPKARVRLHSVGAPEPYMAIRYRRQPQGFIPSTVHPNCRCVPVVLHKDYHIGFDQAAHGKSDFLASTLAQARGRIIRTMQNEIDRCIMTGDFVNGAKRTHIKEKAMFDRKTLKANRFYVGSSRALRDGWGKPTLQEAVDHAKALVKETGEDQFVVQIVRVVREKETPVIVETVK